MYCVPCRVRIPYVQLREATILAQALFRGRQARAMLPKVRKEKAQRDVRASVRSVLSTLSLFLLCCKATEEEAGGMEKERHSSR